MEQWATRDIFFVNCKHIQSFSPHLHINHFYSVVDFVYILFFEKSQTVWFIHFLFLFAFDSYSSSLLIEFTKAKISIYRCRHVEKRNWNCTVASVFKSKMDVIFRAKHLNYFRWLNFNGKSLVEVMFSKSWESSIHLFRLTYVHDTTLPAFSSCKTAKTFTHTHSTSHGRFSFMRQECWCLFADSEKVNRSLESKTVKNIATEFILNTK